MAYVEDANLVSYGERFSHNSLEPEWKAKAGEVYDVTILRVVLLKLNQLRQFLVNLLESVACDKILFRIHYLTESKTEYNSLSDLHANYSK